MKADSKQSLVIFVLNESLCFPHFRLAFMCFLHYFRSLNSEDRDVLSEHEVKRVRVGQETPSLQEGIKDEYRPFSLLCMNVGATIKTFNSSILPSYSSVFL